jgi:hypothetical protein
MYMPMAKLSYYVIESKLTPDMSIVVGFKYLCNWFVLQKLVRGQPCMCAELAHASENTSMIYSIYEAVREKLVGSPVEQMSSKVSSIKCNYQNGEFIISINCSNNTSSAKKIVSAIVSKMTPSKYYNRYCNNIRLLNGKPSRSEFIYCSNELGDVSLNVFAIGKLSPTKFKEFINAVSIKIPAHTKQHGGTKPHSLTKIAGETEYPINEADGYKAIFVRDYIKFVTGYNAVIKSGKVITYNKKWTKDRLKQKIKSVDAIGKFVQKKYARLGDKFHDMIVYTSGTNGDVDTDTLKALCDDHPSSDKIVDIISLSLV